MDGALNAPEAQQDDLGFRPAKPVQSAPSASDDIGFRPAAPQPAQPKAVIPPPVTDQSIAEANAPMAVQPANPAPAAQPQAPAEPVASVSAHNPTFGESLRAAVSNTAIGHSLQTALPKVADALGLTPTESANSPTYEQHKDQLIAPEYLVKHEGDASAAPTPFENRVRGAATAAGELTSGKNMAIMAGTAIAASLTAGAINPASAKVLGRLVSGGFTGDMLYGLYNQHKAYRDAVDRGDTATAQKIQGEMGVNGVMALLTASHASGVHPKVEATTGDFGSRGAKVSVPGASADVGFRPAYRQPAPEGGYGEGSSVVPGKVSAGVTVAGRRFGTSPDVRPVVEPTPAPEPKMLSEGERPVVQASSDPAAIRESAAAQEKPTVAAVEKAVQDIPGAEVDGSRVKDEESQANKADRDKPVETQKDHLGVRVAADTPEAHRAAVGAIAQTMPVVGTEPLENNGLNGTQVMVQTGRPGEANQVSEIQVVPTSQVEAMKETDALYHQQKEAMAAGDTEKADALGKKITEIHEKAMTKEKSELPVKSDDVGTSAEPKYKFGSTQANIPEGSEAHAGLMAAAKKIDQADLNPTSYGGDDKGLEPDPHVTVRYGVQGEDTAKLEAFIRSLAPFEAKLGKTSAFPPSESSDGGAVIKADIESPELHRINAEIEKHGDFAPSSFPDYVPHATVAYVKPDAVQKYVGMTETEGKTFPVKSIAITDRNGGAKEIPLEGGMVPNSADEGGRGESPEQPAAGGAKALPATATLDEQRSAALKDTLNAEAPYGQRMDDIFGEEDWREMSEDARRDAIEEQYREAERDEEREAAKEKKSRERDEQIERNIAFMDKHQEAVESLLKQHGLPFESKGRSVYSRYITVDFPGEEFATIRISDHAPPVGRGGMKEGGLDYHEAADASIHPGSESLDPVKALIKVHEPTPPTAPKVKTGSNVVLPDGRSGVVKGISPKGDVEVKLDGGGRARAKRGDVRVVDKNDPGPIGAPLNTRVDQLKKLVADGTPVKIFTVRANDPRVPAYLEKIGLGGLPVTDVKGEDFGTLVDNQVNVPTDTNEPFDIPPIPKGKALYVDLDGTIAKEVPTEGAKSEQVNDEAKGNAARPVPEAENKPAVEKPSAEVQRDGGQAKEKVEPPKPGDVLYHVVGSGWKAGDDLTSFDELRERGTPKKWKWDEGATHSSDVVSLHGTLKDAVDHKAEFGGKILRIDVPNDQDELDEHRPNVNLEGYRTLKSIPADWISIPDGKEVRASENARNQKIKDDAIAHKEKNRKIYDAFIARQTPEELAALPKTPEEYDARSTQIWNKQRLVAEPILKIPFRERTPEQADRLEASETERDRQIRELGLRPPAEAKEASPVEKWKAATDKRQPKKVEVEAVPKGEAPAPIAEKKSVDDPEAGVLDLTYLRDMAAPLREELERRGEIADVAHDVQGTLQRLERTNKAATLEAKGIARAFQDAGFTKADGDAVFAHLEDPTVKLTAKQEALRDKWIKPLDRRAATQRRIALLIKSGEFPLEDILADKVPQEDVDRIAPEQENYQHRIAADKNSFVDKILGDSMKRFRAPGAALSRAFSSSKRSVFQEIRGTNGEREAVAVKGGRVTKFEPGPDGKPVLTDMGDHRSHFVTAEDILDEKTSGVAGRIVKLERSMKTLLDAMRGPDLDQARLDKLTAKLDDLKAAQAQIKAEYSPETLKDRAVTRQELLDKAIAPLQRRLDALQKEWDTLTATPSRWRASSRRTDAIYEELSELDQTLNAMKESVTPDVADEKLWHDRKTGRLEPREEAKDGQRRSDALKKRLVPVYRQITKLTTQIKDLERITNRTPKLERDLERMHKRLTELEQTKAAIEDVHHEEGLEGRYWRDKDGKLWKFDRGTTKFITERTGQKYHANAMLSSLVNYMETNKAMNAAIVMERTKGLLEDQGMALKTDNPSTVPDGWKPTTLLQMHGYYFPSHIADALDQFDYLQSRGQPNVLERANRFIIQSVLMNPLMHGKNILANAFTGKAAEAITGGALRPKWYEGNMKAGVKAVNTLRDIGGPEYRRLLRLGLDLQGADSSFDQTTKDILRSFTDQLAKDKESNAAMSALLKVGDAAKWLQSMNHLATFGINDLFLLQSFYAREAELQSKFIPNASEAARDWAHQQVAEYTTPIRVGGSAAVGRLMENPNLSAFWRYHFGGILRPVMNAVNESVGPFKPDEDTTDGWQERNSRGQTQAQARTNAIGRLAVMTLFATVVFPKVLDKLAKKMTGDEQAKAPRGGVLGFASNVAETAEGERSLGSLVGSVFTPALGTEELAEIGINRDFFTGRHIMGTNVGFEDKVKQLGSWLVSKSTPGQMTHRLDQGKGNQALWSLLGFTFSMEHGLKEAAELRSEAAGSNPADPQKAKVFQSILAAAEQTQRSGGKDTRLKDALLKTKVLSPAQRKELIQASHEAPIVFATADLEHDADVWQVYQHSTDEEKHQLVTDPRTHRRMVKYETQLRQNGKKDEADKIQKEIH